jgi:hypothetical protein
VTVDRKQRNRPYRTAWDEPGQEFYARQEPANRSGAGYAVAFLMLLALAVVCVAGFLVVRLLTPASSPGILPRFETWTPSPTARGAGDGSPVAEQPTPIPDTPVPGNALVNIDPGQGYINTLITVSGQGWWPGEPVFVFLRSQDEGDGRGYSYAAAVADDQGNIRTAFTFPNELRWIGQQWADVIARGTRSGREASIRFVLVAPTATATAVPPTARPTQRPTNTPPPTHTPTPTLTPTPELVITDWQGEYFSNSTLSGNPALVRNDVGIDFNWGDGAPATGLPADRFSARWTRRVRFDEGTYRFIAAADDGVRLWIDDQLIIDQWHDGPLTPYSADVSLAKGRHSIRLEYYENVGGAAVNLTWARLEVATVTPTRTPTPTATPTSQPNLPDSWHGEYYANPDLMGEPVLVREDTDVDFDWGAGSPGSGLPADNFSVRWTRDIWTSAGDYRFVLQADDGVRFWVDGTLLVDEWHVGTGETYRVKVSLSEGVHSLRIEYNEIYLNASIHYDRKLVTR